MDVGDKFIALECRQHENRVNPILTIDGVKANHRNQTGIIFGRGHLVSR
jgi:hypothetical protein